MITGVAIVRDEIDNVDRLLSAPVDSWSILDTGSTDGTYEELVRRAIPVGREGWADFGTARSSMFEAARGRHADWLLMLDADMTVEWDEGWEPDPAVEAYGVGIRCAQSPDFEWRMPLLLRGDLPWKSVGAVHEYTTLPDRLPVVVPTTAVRVTVQDRSSPEKTARYASLLEAEVERDPSNSRSVFYLAQTYREMGDYRAAAMYKRRIEMGGWDQETYYAMYRYALLLPTWSMQLTALLAAWEFRPTRLEALHAAISELNRQSQHRTAYALSQQAMPTTDALFVHTDVWDWGMAFERSIAAWWVGEREESRMIGRSLLERTLPPDIRSAVERNLTF